MSEQGKKMPLLKLVFIITDWEKAERVTEVLKEDKVFLFFQLMASGTARSEMLDILGIGGSDKALTLCLAPVTSAGRLLADISRKFKMAVPGNGIAFMTPLSGVSKLGSLMLGEDVAEITNEKLEKEVERMKQEQHSHDLIISIINQGYSEELMDAAREAGAGGGTVIHARRVEGEIPAKFLGISIHEEKELVLILSEKEKKMDIMKAVNTRCGLTSDAQGIVMSLPVDAVMGL